MKKNRLKILNVIVFMALIVSFILPTLAPWHNAQAASKFQINGFYLGASPDDIGVTVYVDPVFDGKYIEVEEGGVDLFFVKGDKKLRLYRIIKDETLRNKDAQSVLSSLKAKYGTPDKQEIKTSSIRPKFKKRYVTTTKNKAVWSISESQEFIVEIETKRVVYELLDHDPENILLQKSEGSDDWYSGEDKWDPDY